MDDIEKPRWQLMVPHFRDMQPAHSQQLPWALIDPDILDRNVRHPDKHLVDWKLVGQTVQDVGQRLYRGEVSYDNPEEQSSPWVQLTPLWSDGKQRTAEWNLIKHWLENPPQVSEKQCANGGRHRLFGVWSRHPNLILPVIWVRNSVTPPAT